MDELSIANSETLIKEKGIYPLPVKVQYTIELMQEKSERLHYFFQQLFTRQEMIYPTREQYEYLNILIDELMEVLPDTTAENVDVTAFKVMLRNNFNHESVRKYCLAEIDRYILEFPGKEIPFLKKALKYCEELSRKDIIYNENAHTLREEVGHSVKLRLESASYFPPFKLLLHANSFYPLIRLLMKAEAIEEMDTGDAGKALSHVFLKDTGQRYSLNTAKNRFKLDDQCNFEDLKVLLEKLDELVDFEIKKRSRPRLG